jgi:hypothetical protein
MQEYVENLKDIPEYLRTQKICEDIKNKTLDIIMLDEIPEEYLNHQICLTYYCNIHICCIKLPKHLNTEKFYTDLFKDSHKHFERIAKEDVTHEICLYIIQCCPKHYLSRLFSRFIPKNLITEQLFEDSLKVCKHTKNIEDFIRVYRLLNDQRS